VGVKIEVIPEHPDNPYRLGRHKQFDERSYAYAYAAQPWRALRTTRWHRHIPILDQSDLHAQGIHVEGDPDALGSCTGNTGVDLLGTDPFFNTVGSQLALQLRDSRNAEHYAIDLYAQASKLDGVDGDWPPVDGGSTGLAIAKALVARGLFDTYLHPFGLTPLLTALQSQPVMVGMNWYESMFEPRANGTMEVRGEIAGGHEILFDAVYMEQRMIRFPNHWTAEWGDAGYGFLTFDQVDRLLGEDGDVVAPYR
jgi:hypothetical protein